MPILLEHAADDRARVTAGIPGLSPEKRRDISESSLKRIYQDALVAEYRGNNEKAIAKDGAIQDVTDIEQVTGIPLNGARLISRLKKLNPNLWFEVSKADPSKSGVYLLKNDLTGGMEKEFIAGFETHWNPEFALRVTDEQGNAKGIVPGWRRMLMRLIRKGLINESAAFRLFGPPSRESENWARFTQ